MNIINTINPRVTGSGTLAAIPAKTPQTLSKKEFHKLLTEMIIALSEVLSQISGNSIDQIELAVGRGKLYAGFIEILQKDLQSKLEAIQKTVVEQQEIEKEQKTLSWVMFSCAIILMIAGTVSAGTGVGVGAGAAAISMGASMLVSSSLELTGAIDDMDKAIDKEYTDAKGVLDEQKAAEAKIGAKISILLVITACTMGVGSIGNASAKAVETAIRTGAQASKAARFGAQFAMGTTKTAKAAFFFENLTFIALNWAPILNMTQDIVTANTGKNGNQETITIINAILMGVSLVFGMGRGKINKGYKKLGLAVKEKYFSKAVKRARNQAATKIQAVYRGHKVRAKAKAKTSAKPTSAAATANAATSSSDNIKECLNSLLKFFKKKLKPENPSESLKSLLTLFKWAALAVMTYAGVKNGMLSIKKGHLYFKEGDLLRDVSALNASEKVTDDMLTANDDFIKTINSFVEKIQNLLRTSAENPKDFIANETEFARILAQAV